jgi:MoxR-like ATPase
MPTTGVDRAAAPSGELSADTAAEQQRLLDACFAEIGKCIVGQQAMVQGMMMALLAGGHVLLEGMPGLAKTRAVKALAEVTDVSFRRLQFTPDLLPADVVGTMVYRPQSGQFVARKGPIFAHVVLADEINRAPAKVQSALLEAMEERQITLGDATYALEDPFLVLATQNPIEQQGTYPLPEAQLDRFLVKLRVPYPAYEEELAVLRLVGDEQPVALRPLLDRAAIAALRASAAAIRVDARIEEYVVTLMRATRPASAGAGAGAAGAVGVAGAHPDYLRFIEHGASPRASICLYRCAKIAALFAGRPFVIPEDVKAVAPDVLRHRLVISYEGESEGITADQVVEALLADVEVP